MAEETHDQDETDFFGSDDQTAMRTVLRMVKGSSPISLAPVIDDIGMDDRPYSEQFQFE